MTDRKRKTVIIVLAALLAVSVCALAGTLVYNHFAEGKPASVTVPDNVITPDKAAAASSLPGTATAANGGSDTGSGPSTQADTESNSAANTVRHAETVQTTQTVGSRTATAIYLYQKQTSDNEPFAVSNMFPGDTETKYFRVRVSHHDAVTVHFQAEIRQGSEELAEVLKTRVVLLTTGETLYDGLMRDMPESVCHTLETDGPATSELYYGITAYLDTSVGNEYMEKDLAADLIWSVGETECLDTPDTGDSAHILLWGAAALLSLLTLILFAGKRRKGETNEK